MFLFSQLHNANAQRKTIQKKVSKTKTKTLYCACARFLIFQKLDSREVPVDQAYDRKARSAVPKPGRQHRTCSEVFINKEYFSNISMRIKYYKNEVK